MIKLGSGSLMSGRILGLLVLALPISLLCSCGGNEAVKGAQLPSVVISHPTQRNVTDYRYVTGNTQAIQTVELRARVSGYLKSVNFEDGTIVKAGDLLFVIEPEPYEARVKLADAAVDSAQAALVRATLEYQRQLELVKKTATSQAQVEQWRASRDAAQADLDQAKANLDIAQINLSYTSITAPFDGRVDKHLKDPGSLVGVGETTLLTTISQVSSMYAYFNINERDLVEIRGYKTERTKEVEPVTKDKVAVPAFLAIEGEKGYPHEGRIDFSSTSLDPGTGTLLLRAVFQNQLINDGPLILPGMFVRIRVPILMDKNALLVPDQALGTDQSGQYVFVTNAEGVVQQRPIEVGARQDDGMRVVEEGLSPDDWVVVDGIMRARRGIKVNTVKKEAQPSPSASTPGAGQASTKNNK